MAEGALSAARRAGETKKERTRARLIEAGAQLLNQGNAASVRVEDIAQAAGVSSATFYNFFKTKAALVEAIFEELVMKPLEEGLHTRDLLGQRPGDAVARYMDLLTGIVFPQTYILRQVMANRLMDEDHADAVVPRFAKNLADCVYTLPDGSRADKTERRWLIGELEPPDDFYLVALMVLDRLARGYRPTAQSTAMVNEWLRSLTGYASQTWYGR